MIRKSKQSGFTLMEVLVGVALLGIVYTVLFGVMSTSLRNVGRMAEREKIVRYGQMKMNELMITINRGLQSEVGFAGRFDEKYGWRAIVQDLESTESTQAPAYVLKRLRLSVDWNGLNGPREYDLETIVWAPGRRGKP